MGLHQKVDSFQASDPSQFTDQRRKREPETRIPAVGAHAGAWEDARPGCTTTRRVVQLERDVALAQKLNAKGKNIVRKRVSANGVLRTRRSTV